MSQAIDDLDRLLLFADGRIADLLLGGWAIAGAITLQSGFPINVQQPQIRDSAARTRIGPT